MNHKMKNRIFKWGNAIALAIMFYVTYLSLALPLGGRTTAELSDMYVSFFTPAGFTFMIWNIIYLGLLAFVLHSFLDRSKGEFGAAHFIPGIGWLFALSCLLNAGWLFAWHYNVIWLSVLIMLSLLYVLIRIYQKLEIGKHQHVSWKRKLFVHAPFQFYLGWISVATVANLSAFFISIGLVMTNTLQQTIAGILMIVVLYLANRMSRARRDAIYAIVISWALFGIGMKYLDDIRETVWIGAPAILLSIVALVLAVFTIRKKVVG